MKVTLLDCTLRDGGYYNKWDFDEKIVKHYLKAMSASCVDFVELGFRFQSKNTFFGPYAYTTDNFINSLELPPGPKYGVMINGKDFITSEDKKNSLINSSFQKKEKSPISLIRIAMNFDSVLTSRSIVECLKDKGYLIGLNMMQSHGKIHEEYVNVAKALSSWDSIDVLFFADSLGNMTPKDIKNICLSIRDGWDGELGIHTHNNKTYALINSITAIENGVSWVDGTITGMGRGAGNAPTESLILEMSNSGYHNGNVKKIQSTIEDFTILKNKYKWGPNLYYHYSANHEIHPSFVQTLLEGRRYGANQIMGALAFLADKDSSSFSANALRKAIYGNHSHYNGDWDASGWLSGETVLIVGAGPSVKKYKDYILQYIEKQSPTVFHLNINPHLPSTNVKASIVCNETRILLDASRYKYLNHPIIMPKKRIGMLIQDELKELDILDYGLILESEAFKIKSNFCILGWPLAIAYALSIITIGEPKAIHLVGFDGYDADDPRQKQMNDILKKYKNTKESVPLLSLTPTNYRIKQGSIFSVI